MSVAFIDVPSFTYVIPPRLDKQFKRLESFVVSSTGVYGTLPDWRFYFLKNFDASKNNLSGTIPRYIFVNNSNLQQFYINGNDHIVGELPPLPTKTSLKCLDIRDTGIIGKLPIEYFKIKHGELLLPMSFNITELQGSIPDDSDMKCVECNKNNECQYNVERTYKRMQMSNNYIPFIWCNSYTNRKNQYCKHLHNL